MNRQTRMAPPLSPILLAGLALRPVPPVVFQPALTAAMAAVRRRHPDVFERLSGLADPVFVIDPTDLPFRFVLRADPESPHLAAVDAEAEVAAAATIRGPLMRLIEMLEGRVDGDALFFTRELVVEGDTEAVVALRNAVDGAEIDVLDDVLSGLGRLAGPARRASGLAGRLYARASEDLETLRAAVLAPAIRRIEGDGAKLRKLDERVSELGRGPRERPSLRRRSAQ